jgi:3-methyladenine DNA glycosylase/8-oxoguanine DNA glycosylase
VNLSLSARQPFSFRSVVNSHGWVQLVPFRFDEESSILTYIDHLASGRVVELKISEIDEGLSVGMNGRFTKAEQKEIADKVSWMFGLDMDFSAFYEAARHEPKLVNAEKLARGRVLRSPTLFEDVIKTILTTNTLWAATKRMTAAVVDQFGETLPDDPARRAFPTPERLARTTEGTLRTKTKLGYRAPYILATAKAVASGQIDLEPLKTSMLPTLDLRKELLKISGIGPYAAANLLNLLGRYDFLPVDSWAMKMVSHEWYNGQPVGQKEVEAAFADWGQWKGLAYWFWDWKYNNE